MSPKSHIRKKLMVSSTPPAAQTLAAYQGLTWKQVKGLTAIPNPSFSHNMINVPDVTEGVTKALKGSQQGQGATGGYYDIEGDEGQGLVETVADQLGDCAIAIVDADGVKADFWTGPLGSLAATEGTDTTHAGKTFQFTPNFQKIRGNYSAGGS